MNFAVTRLDLGQTRLGIGWVLYEDEHGSFLETKPRDVKRLIKEKDVMGLKLSEDGETIMVDTDFVQDLASKTGVGNYRYVIHGFNPGFMKEILIIVAKYNSYLGTFYEIVTPFYQRFIVSEKRMKAMMNNGDDIIGGVYLDENGDIVLKQGVKHYLVQEPASGDDRDLNDAKILLNDGFNDLFEDSAALAEVDNSVFASNDELAEFFGVSKEEMGEILNSDVADSDENSSESDDSFSDENLPFGSGQSEEGEDPVEGVMNTEDEQADSMEAEETPVEDEQADSVEQVDSVENTETLIDTQADTQADGNGDESVKKSKGKRRSKKSDKAEEQ